MRRFTLTFYSLSVLSLFAAAGCTSTYSDNPSPSSSTANPQTGGLVVQVDRSQAKKLEDLARGFLDATRITVRVLNPLDGEEIIPSTVVVGNSGGALQEIRLTGIPLGRVRILITAEDQAGNSLGTAEQVADVGPTQQVVLFSSIFDPGPTREIGLLSTSANGVPSNGVSLSPSISADGRYVAFSSNATNLVTGETSAQPDIFVRDRTLGTLTRVSVATDGGPIVPANNGFVRPSISPDGQKVAFSRGGVGDIFLREKGILGSIGGFTGVGGIVSSRTVQVNVGTVAGFTVGSGSSPRVSNTREVIFITTPPSGKKQVVLKNVLTGALELVSVSTSGGLANNDCENASISGDGRFVLFRSTASNLAGAGGSAFYLRDRVQATTTRLTLTGDFAGMSTDARFIAASSADVGSPGLFVLDRASGNITTATTQAMSGKPGVSNDGQVVCHSFEALIPGDGNGVGDCYHWHPVAGFSRVNVAAEGFAVEGTLNVASQLEGPEISANGSRVTFASADGLLVPGDNNGTSDVFSAIPPSPGKLYVTLGNAILRFDQAASLTGAPVPSATISGSSTGLNNPGKIALDATHDRLYVANEGSEEMLVFENISTRTGNIAPDRRFSATITFGLVKDMLLDVTRDRMYLASTFAQMIPRISAATGNLIVAGSPTPVTSFTNAGLFAQRLLLDERRNELYVGGSQSSSRILSVFGNLGLPVGQTPRRTKDSGAIANPHFGLAFDNSPLGVANPPDPTTSNKPAGPNGSLLAILGNFGAEGNTLRTFSNGSADGNFSVNTVMQGGDLNQTHNYDGLALERYTGQAYILDKTTGDLLVAPKASQSGPLTALRKIQFNGTPRGFVVDRTH